MLLKIELSLPVGASTRISLRCGGADHSIVKPMRAVSAIAAAVFVAILVPAQSSETAPEPERKDTSLLGVYKRTRVRMHMADVLRNQPNYTCVETIERYSRNSGQLNFSLEDRVRLEVALIDGGEMFAWPGSEKFEEAGIEGLEKLIPGGIAGSGNFASDTRRMFLDGAAQIEYRGADSLAGDLGLLERYDFRMPRAVSGYNFRMRGISKIVGYHGSFWAEQGSFDFRRLDVIFDDLLPEAILWSVYLLEHLQLSPATLRRLKGSSTASVPVAAPEGG